MVSYYIVFIDNGFSPSSLLHAGASWDDASVTFTDSFGRVGRSATPTPMRLRLGVVAHQCEMV